MILLLGSSHAIETKRQNRQGDYTTIVCNGDGFVAASNNGRIDWVSNAGEIKKSENFSGSILNSLLVVDQYIYAAGDNGLMLIGSELEVFKKIDSGTGKNINSLTLFKGKIIAAAQGGEIAVGEVSGLFKTIQLDLIGNIVSVSANTTDCYGVTDKGEIIYSKDGMNWSVFDFNKTYNGFYKNCQFTKVLTTENQISIIGKQDDGLPVMFYSSRGSVWTQRDLVYTGQSGEASLLKDSLNDIFYDITKDQFILICNHGKIMTIPSCSHCNKLFEVNSENLLGVAGNEKMLVVVGENGYIQSEHIEYF